MMTQDNMDDLFKDIEEYNRQNFAERSGVGMWIPRTGADIRKPEDLPERPKILGDILPQRGLVVFHGLPGSMKSMLVMDAVMCLVSGSVWLPPMQGSTPKRYNLQATKNRCMWLDMDQGNETTEERLSALREAHAPFDPNDLLWLSMPNPKFAADDARSVIEFADWLKEYEVKVLVIDNLSNIRGKESLNDDGMSRVLENLRYIADLAGCLVIIIHHDAKHTNKFFGSVYIDANLDYRYHVVRFEDSDAIRVSTEKSRHSKPAGSIIATFAYDHLNEHGQLASARMYATQEPQDESMQSEILNTLRYMQDNNLLPTTKSKIESMHKEYGTGGRAETVRAAIGELVENGMLRQTGSTSNGYPQFDLMSSEHGTKYASN